MTNPDWQKWVTERWVLFDHSYIDARARKKWACSSLSEASQKYVWNGQNRENTNLKLDDFSRQLQMALRSGNNDETAAICHKVMRWGKVGQNPQHATPIWIEKCLRAGTLVTAIYDNLQALHAGNAGFFNQDRPMDSAATKIMALADTDDYGVIIYDSRVAAALAYLARLYLLEIGATEVPPDLCFPIPPWRKASRGLGRNRNPSFGSLKFPPTGSNARRFATHSQGKILASRLIADVAKATGVSVRDWEQALFMVGYDL